MPIRGKRIRFKGRLRQASHVIWFKHYGYWPSAQLDHRDLDHNNDSIGNLREATASQNKCNNRVRVDSRTGVKGVTQEKHPHRRKRFRAHIAAGGKRVISPYFATIEEAVAWRRDHAYLQGEFYRE